MTRYHLVTEWQRRGMPHLHMAVWFHGLDRSSHGSLQAVLGGSGPNGSIIEGVDIPLGTDLINLWLKIASEGSPSRVSQDVKPITSEDAGHWLQYLAKHAVRGVSNYQRHSSNIPKEWKGATGRVWRKGGDWPIENRVEVHGLSKKEQYQYRRIFCRYLSSLPSSMRIKSSDRRKVSRYWKNWRRCTDVTRSHLRAPSSFISIETQVKIIKSVNPAAFFVDEVTGEIFNSVEEMPINRTATWTPPPIHRPVQDMSDIC